MRVDVYTHQGAYVGTIGPSELLALAHTDELNGEDSISITTSFPLKQGYRLVWADRLGKAHEHICQDPKGLHAQSRTVYTDTALNSVYELTYDYIEDKRPYSYSFLKALQVALESTRWECGTVDRSGTVSSGLTFYHTSVRAALNDILECGGELETVIEVDGEGVTSRKVGIRQHRGESATHRRFTYTKDLVSVGRTEHYGAITACYGYGKGVETDSGGHGRKLTFGDINDGKNYVEDAAALKTWGRPDGKGGFAHVFGEYEASDCEDAAALLSETRAYLDKHKEPGMTYEADVIDLVQFGRSWEGVAVGDDVQIVDIEFSPELRCQGRVTKLVTDLLSGAMTVTLGNVTETMADMWAVQQRRVSSLSKRSSNWDVAANTPAAYLQQVIDGLNEQFNTQGMSYCFTSFEQGTIWASVPLDDNGLPTKTGGSAIQVCSQGFRIASGTKADGSWDWRTFGTGKGFTADLITTGSLLASLITTGIIQDKTGNNYWNLDTGELRMTGYAKDSETISSVDVEYAQNQSATTAPTSGWQTTAPAYKSGYYIWSRTKTVNADGGASYSMAVMISGRDGADGGKGDTGATGIGVSAIVEQYYLSTSKTAQSGGSWSEAQPAYVSGRYYWTRSKVTWTDGKVTYTTPVLAQGVNNANESAQKANDAVTTLDEALDQEEVLNRLTNGSKEQGIYLEDGKLYINGTYIKSGTVDAGLLKAGKLLVTNKTTGATVFCADISAGTCYIGGDSVQIGGTSLTDKASALESGQAALEATYGVCSTAAATAAKTVSIPGFVLKKGASVRVKFAYANTAGNPTLNVNSTGAKSIVYGSYGYLLERYYWKSGDLLTFTYNGGAWELADDASRKNARTIWANDTTSVTVEAGTITMNSGSKIAFGTGGTFTLDSTNMTVSSSGTVTANNFTATGAFTGGVTSGTGYGMKLGTDGTLRGYRNGTETGRVDPTASVRNVSTGAVSYGLQLYGAGCLREVSPSVSTLNSSSTSGTSTLVKTTSVTLLDSTWVSECTDENVVLTSSRKTLSFINGRLTSVG